MPQLMPLMWSISNLFVLLLLLLLIMLYSNYASPFKGANLVVVKNSVSWCW